MLVQVEVVVGVCDNSTVWHGLEISRLQRKGINMEHIGYLVLGDNPIRSDSCYAPLTVFVCADLVG